MDAMRIISNYHWNNLLYGYELTENERAEFDYIPADEIDLHDFIRYRGVLYDPAEFMRTPCDEPERKELNALCAWDGYQSDSFFSAVVIRYDDAFERYQIGTYIY